MYSWPDGCVYTGSWKLGRRHGRGEMVHSHLPDGIIMVIMMVLIDVRQKWEDGTRFEGTWVNDIRVEENGKCFDAEGNEVAIFAWGSKTYDDYFNLDDELWDVKYASHH